jgi:hypothetical protein
MIDKVMFVDDVFEQDALEFYSQFGVITPTLFDTYTVRDVKKSSDYTRGVGITLQEIVNTPVPINFVGAVLWLEPSWSIDRFRTIDGKEININDLNKP